MDNSLRKFFVAVYSWMFIGLSVTGLISYFVAQDPELMKTIFSPIPLIAMIVVELILVIVIASAAEQMGTVITALVFLLYAALNGMTFSGVFYVYTLPSIGITFAVTAGMYGITALYGIVTKSDLSSLGSILFMALIGLILGSVVNIFLANPVLDWLITFAGIITFVGLTAYDNQKLKEQAGYDPSGADAIRGALSLYLDFINLFLYLLKIFGKRKD